MLSANQKGLFIDYNEFSILAAVTSGLDAPFNIERLEECDDPNDEESVSKFFESLVQVKGKQYVQARCGVYPKSRFLRRKTLDQPAKAKEPGFFVDMLQNQFRIDPETNAIAVLNAGTGGEFDDAAASAGQKEVLFCGASREELETEQQAVLNYTVYPNRLEIGTVATLGGLMNYVKKREISFPTLTLEITADSSYIFIFGSESLDICRPIPYGLNSMFPVIQSELGLKDEASARKLFFSNTFDFTEMGPVLLRKMMKELQASTGFYEVQTGQTIGQVFLSLLPRNLAWIQKTLSRTLGVETLHVDFPRWLNDMGVTTSDNVQLEGLDNRWVGLFSLMGTF